MSTLIKYEFLKILRKKATLTVMGAALIVTVFLAALPVLQYQTYTADGVIQGLEGIAYEKRQAEKYAVPLTDEYVAETIRQVQALFENPANVGYDGQEEFLVDAAYWNDIAPREKLLDLIAQNYAEPGQSVGYSSLAADVNLNQELPFYAARQEKIEKLLNQTSRHLSAGQKAWWQNLNRQVQQPFQYGYYEGWEIVMNSFEQLMFAVLAICFVLARVFAGEYEAGTDAVILSARYGKTKLGTAKIIASYLFGGLAFTLYVLVAFGLPLAAFGVDGWNLPLQIASTTIPYPWTFLQAVLVNLGVVYLVLFAMMALTLLLSAKMKSPYLVVAILVPVLFIPLFLAPNGTSGLYNLTLFLLPYRSVTPEVGKYITYQIGGLVLDAFAMRAILYALLSAILLPLARLTFRKHQVA